MDRTPPAAKSDEIEEVDRFLASEAKKEADELYAGKDTQMIELSDIRFGMRTSSPVFTRQGKLVLRAGVKFAEQIVWGLWQLVAVCPLLNPISVLK